MPNRRASAQQNLDAMSLERPTDLFVRQAEQQIRTNSGLPNGMVFLTPQTVAFRSSKGAQFRAPVIPD